MRIKNRSDGKVAYTLPEMNINRSFELNEVKDIPSDEAEALFQSVGGCDLVKNYLFVDDKEWVKKHWDAPIEYFWTDDDIKNCLLNDSIELFRETLEFAPWGVVDLIKQYAWRLPISDLNKIAAIKEMTGFDVLMAIELMKATKPKERPAKRKRLREEG